MTRLPANRSQWILVVVACVSTATLIRLLLQPVLGQRAVFVLAILAVAVSAHLAGSRAGIATTLLAFPLAALLFLDRPAPVALGTPGWLQMVLSLALAVPLSMLGGRFHQMVAELDHALRRERTARAEVEQANRARDEFLAVLSHELRTPLNAIVGWAHVLNNRQTRDADDRRAIETILRNADHQVRLMSDITDLSRGITGKLVLDRAVVDVWPVLDQAADAVRLSAEARRIQLQVVAAESPLLVQGDAARLRQVFWNLLSNAIKFSPSGAVVHASAGREGEFIVVKVSDLGQGIGSDFLPHVFDLFRQEDATKSRRQGGLGIGLAIVRHLTEAHGGTVAVESGGAGQGTTFTVRLPVSAPSVPGGEGTGEVAGPPLAGVRVLVVDDDQDSREMLTRSLRELGADVTSAASAAEARVELSRRRPHAIVSDVGMPEEDGLAFVRSLKKHVDHAGIPAIALTAYASLKDRNEALAAGCYDHVTKPAPPHQLARVIAAAVRGSG